MISRIFCFQILLSTFALSLLLLVVGYTQLHKYEVRRSYPLRQVDIEPSLTKDILDVKQLYRDVDRSSQLFTLNNQEEKFTGIAPSYNGSRENLESDFDEKVGDEDDKMGSRISKTWKYYIAKNREQDDLDSDENMRDSTSKQSSAEDGGRRKNKAKIADENEESDENDSDEDD